MKNTLVGIVCLAVLIGCGGGGGSESKPPVNTNPVLFLAPEKLTLTVDEGGGTSFLVQAAATKVLPGIVNVAIVDVAGVLDSDVKISQLDSQHYQATLSTNRQLAAGTYDGVIEVRLCKDNPAVCAQPHEGSPLKLPYHIVVRTDLKLASTNPISGTTPEASVFAFPAVGITLPTGQTALDYDVIYANGTGWLSAAALNGQLLVTANAAGLVPGKYMASLTMRGLSTRKTVVTIPVTLTVGSGFAAPGMLTLQIDGQTPATDSGQAIQATIGAAKPTQWSVSSDQTWLKVDTPTGATGAANNLLLHVDPAQTAALGNNRTVKATLTLSDKSNGYQNLAIEVDVNLKLPELMASAPFHLQAGAGERVTVYGKNLDRVLLSSLTFGGAPASNAVLLSSTTLRFDAPPVTASGDYAIAAARQPRTFALPAITAAGEHALAFLPAASTNEPDQARRLVFDDGRNDLYVSNYNGVAKYHYAGTTWTRSWLSLPDAVYAIALSPDRKTLVAAAKGSLYLIDIARFVTTKSVTHIYPDAYQMEPRSATISFAPDGRLFMSNSARGFDVATAAFTGAVEAGSRGADSANLFGNQLFVNNDPDNSTVNHSWTRMSAGEQTFTRGALRFECNVSVVSTSRYGEVTSCAHRFYSAAGGLIGDIPNNGYDGSGFNVIAPDGRNVYAIFPNSARIYQYQFDNGFRKVGMFNSATLSNTEWDYGLYGSLNDAVISQDGRTLFVALPKGLHIIPVSSMIPVN